MLVQFIHLDRGNDMVKRLRMLAMGMGVGIALLGVIGLGSVRSAATMLPIAAHAQLLADGTPTPAGPVCPGGGSTSCG